MLSRWQGGLGVKLRQINERSRVVAAQAAIVTSQAVRGDQAG